MSNSVPLTDKEQLQELKSACQQLWPFIRHICLIGAPPEATEATLKIGRLIGEISPARQSQEAADAIRQQTLQNMIEWFQNSRYPRLMTRKGREDFVAELDQMSRQ